MPFDMKRKTVKINILIPDNLKILNEGMAYLYSFASINEIE
jgi:hypothetical protein